MKQISSRQCKFFKGGRTRSEGGSGWEGGKAKAEYLLLGRCCPGEPHREALSSRRRCQPTDEGGSGLTKPGAGDLSLFSAPGEEANAPRRDAQTAAFIPRPLPLAERPEARETATSSSWRDLSACTATPAGGSAPSLRRRAASEGKRSQPQALPSFASM